MLYVVLVLAGMGIGIIFTSIFRHKKVVGFLRVDRSDPFEEPYLFLELSKDVGDISNMDYVTLQVKVKNYISHD